VETSEVGAILASDPKLLKLTVLRKMFNFCRKERPLWRPREIYRPTILGVMAMSNEPL